MGNPAADLHAALSLPGAATLGKTAKPTPKNLMPGATKQLNPSRQIAPGNIDLNNRPIVHNPDGSISTVRSITVTDDRGHATLIPTVVGDKVVSNKQAVAHYQRTGQHLGVFTDEKTANAYAAALHRSQAKKYVPQPSLAPTKPVQTAAPSQAANKALYLQTVKDVRAGKMTEAQGGAKLTKAGFPAHDNPFVVNPTGGIGGIAKAVLRKVEPASARGEAARPINLKTTRPNAGIVTPGAGIVAGLIGGAAQKAVYAPAGVYDVARHPVRTVEHLGHNLATTLAHPGRDPAQTFFDATLAAGAAGGTLGRLLGAGKALKAGEGAKAAVTRPTYKGGSLLHSPAPAPRSYQVGNEEVRLLPSRNLAWRGVQEVYDRAARGALAKNPQGRLAANATKRLGKSLEETRRWQGDLAQVPAAELAAAGKPLASMKLSPQTKRENLLAIRLVAKNTTPEEQLAFHQAQMDKPIGSAAYQNHAKQVKTLQGIAKRGLVTTDAAGNAVAAGQIAKAEALHHEVGNLGEKIQRDTGLMTAEGQATRRDAPNRIIAGATYEKPTPGKMGVASPALLRQRTYVARLEQLHARATAKAAEKATPYANVHTRTGLVKQDLFSAPEAALKRQHVEVAPGPRTPGQPSALPPKGINNPITERLGSALSVARDRLQQMEKTAANRVTPTGIVGGEGARPGRTFVSDKQTRAKTGGGVFGTAPGKVVGVARNPLSPMHPYTGGAEQAGLIPENPIRSMAEHYRGLIKYANTNEFRQTAANMGADAKQTERDVLINTQELKHPKVPDATHVALGSKELTTEDLAGHTAGFEDWLRRVLPGTADRFATDKTAAIGHPAPEGYKWVDAHLLGDLAKPRPSLEDMIGKHATNVNDAINNASKAAIVYMKPGHFATRYVTNSTLTILHGAANPLEVARSVKMARALTDREQLQFAALGGQGYVHAIFDPIEGRGAVSRVAGKAAGMGAKFWGHTDSPFRFNAVAYELRKAGIRTPAQVKAVLANPDRYRWQLDDAVKRANRENIQYDRLSPREKQVVSRVLWFYPWVKGSTIYAGRLMYEHPIKAGVIANLGTEGQQQAEKDLGPVPSTQEGLLKTGGSDAFPLTSQPRGVSLVATPAEVANTGLGLLGGKFGTAAAEAGRMTTPALRLAAALAYKTNSFGSQQPAASAGKILKQQLWTNTPEALAFNRLRELGYLKGLGVNPSQSKIQQQIGKALKAGAITQADAKALLVAAKAAPSKKTFPTSLGETLGMPLAGSWFPRATNKATLNAQAAKEMSPAARLHFQLEQAVKAKVLTAAEAKQLEKTAAP